MYKRMESIVLSSKKITVLSTLFSRYEMSSYLTVVMNPDIRNIYTSLSIDMKILFQSGSVLCWNLRDECMFVF